MRDARHQLILLGLIGQALTWEGPWLLMFLVACWLAAVFIGCRNWRLPSWAEGILLVGGSLTGWLLSKGLGQNAHFFLGYGVAAIQLVRMLRPLTRREQILSILLALLQVGVACAILLDFRFLLVGAATLVLIPRVFFELERQNFATYASHPTAGIRWPLLGVVTLLALFIYAVFPRNFLGTPLHTASMSSNGSLEDAILDVSDSGFGQSSRVIFQIDGQNLGYLRGATLVDFDGVRWYPDKRAPLQRIKQLPVENLGSKGYRRVRVKLENVVGKVLPTDGTVVRLQGNFFRRPLLNAHDLVECESVWNTSDSIYEYWIRPERETSALSERLKRRLLWYPKVSPRLRNWLDGILEAQEDPLRKARYLERYLQDHFAYELGAPQLNRLNPVEDFVFNQRRGHCERFASTLALLLRMEGIPSRVVLGYLPRSRQWMSDWYNIRFKDAHAWTEAWFPDVGWIQLDATPRWEMEEPIGYLDQLWESLSMAWYLHVVNFDGTAQRQLIRSITTFLQRLPFRIQRNPEVLLLPAMLLLWWIKRNPQKWSQFSFGKMKPGNEWRPAAPLSSIRVYQEMLEVLEQRGLVKPSHVTPREFVEWCSNLGLSNVDDLKRLTDYFCESRYGNRPVSEEQQHMLETSLKRIRESEIVSAH